AKGGGEPGLCVCVHSMCSPFSGRRDLMRSTLIPVLSLLAIAATAPVALAQHEGDVGLTIVGNRITTNLIDNSVFTPERVFGAEFGELFPNFTDEPGFDTLPGTFAPGSMIGLNVLRALREWDGST